MREKVLHLELIDDDELEFEFALAEKLGRTVEELRASGISQREFVQWQKYWARKGQREQLANRMQRR